jgi:type II secretory pathway predicted ATPase ExeA
MDDSEEMRAETLDLVRGLTAGELDDHNRFSVLLAAKERLLVTLREPVLAPLRTRIAYVGVLRTSGIEDTRNYVRFSPEQATADPSLFSDHTATAQFHATERVPRAINQLALNPSSRPSRMAGTRSKAN